MKRISELLSYNKEEELQFLGKRLCGFWLIWIGIVMVVAIACGGEQLVNNAIFVIGYGTGFYLLFGVKSIRGKLAYGPPSVFQRKMMMLSFILMFVLMVLLGGPFFATLDFRMIWLGALLAVAIHFIPFAYVHGRWMLVLAALLIILITIGYANPDIRFATIGYTDATLKILIGVILLFSRKPVDADY